MRIASRRKHRLIYLFCADIVWSGEEDKMRIALLRNRRNMRANLRGSVAARQSEEGRSSPRMQVCFCKKKVLKKNMYRTCFLCTVFCHATRLHAVRLESWTEGGIAFREVSETMRSADEELLRVRVQLNQVFKKSKVCCDSTIQFELRPDFLSVSIYFVACGINQVKHEYHRY